jgi:hypothetical protein
VPPRHLISLCHKSSRSRALCGPCSSFDKPHHVSEHLLSTPFHLSQSYSAFYATHLTSCSGQFTAAVLAKPMSWPAVLFITDRCQGGIPYPPLSPSPRSCFLSVPSFSFCLRPLVLVFSPSPRTPAKMKRNVRRLCRRHAHHERERDEWFRVFF